jgi:hypothetical protein
MRLLFRFVRASYHGHWLLFTGRDRRTGLTLLSRYAHLSSRIDIIEWHPQELKNRPQPSKFTIKALVPSMKPSYTFPSSCRLINFAEAATDLTQEGHVSFTSYKLLLLSLDVDRSSPPDLSTSNSGRHYLRNWENRLQRWLTLILTGYRGHVQ